MKVMEHSKTVYLDINGNLFKFSNAKLLSYHPKNNPTDEILKKIQKNPYQIFFKNPFHGITYAVENEIIETFRAHPSSFYPGTPFDVFTAVKAYLKDSHLVIPRFYLFPSSICNSQCPICQFNFRRKTPSYLKWGLIKKMLDYMVCQNPKPHRLSSIISGDGEPTLHPDFIQMMNYFTVLNIGTFLTSNWILPHDKKTRIIDAVARNVSMLTISIKGLNSAAYHKYQGIESYKNVFDRVIKNLEILLERLEKVGRRNEILVGIATLILPENTQSYLKMIEYFISNKLDYVYLNVVEPCYEKWGISFSSREEKMTMDMLASLKKYENCGTLIRYPTNPFKTRFKDTVYYNASDRKCKNICGSALWNPIIIPKKNRDGIFLSCRSSENFNNKNFWYSDSIADGNLQDCLCVHKISRVMESTKDCHQCRLERQVKLFDNILTLEIQNNLKGSFLLTFDIEKLLKKNGAIPFEETF